MSILNSTIADPYDVLVVDDQPMIIEAVRRLLRSDSNARVHGCGFALEALARAKDLLPAVILQDLTMTDGYGLDLVTAYRAEQVLAETSVVVLSGIEDPQVKAEAFARGAADYIEKLPPLVEFVARVKHHARASRAQKQLVQAAVAQARAEEQAQWADTLIFRMVEMARLRDPTETAGHVQRVAGISKILFKTWMKAHLRPDTECKSQQELLRIAALLHDVGKVGILDAILRKPGKLDEVERAEMEKHAKIGEGIFIGSRSKLDDPAAEVALCHHEKWDGSGYPQKLRGEEIPLFARIIAVADVYDALGSRRAYKEPWPRERIEKLFAEEAGKHFDPELSAILLANMDEVEQVRDAFPEQEIHAI
jgi:putative two-component system response regulator